MLNKICPKCSGKMYIELINGDEVCCINCGYMEYISGIIEERLLGVSKPHRRPRYPFRQVKQPVKNTLM